MRDEDPVCRDLKIAQDAFFRAAERDGYPIAILAARTGIPGPTLASYRATQSREPSIMSLATLVKLAREVPPELATILVSGSGCVLARSDPQASTWLGIGERAGALAAKVCKYQATGGHIDHVEAADLRADMIEILTEGHGVMSGGARGA